MTDSEKLSNSYIAKIEADKIDEQIINVLIEGKSFRVEAGAGSGKTYSLNKVIEWIQNNKWNEFKRKKQNVICITYTNAAVDVITERLKEKSFILPSTIHSFAWGAIKSYQKALIEMVKINESLHPKEGDIGLIEEIQYTLGHKYINDNVLFLHHNDVITLFSCLLENAKFRSIFSDKYPLILIDEYQDSFKQIIDKFLDFFISKNKGPQFGFFGDAWQTIYQSNKACGLIEHENIVEIKKVSNFRSATKIVDLLNKIRPDLPQISAIDDFDGEVAVVICNDFSGTRRTDRNFKGELPVEELKNRLVALSNTVISKIKAAGETIKTLMITHKVLAAQQGYGALLDILDDKLKDKEDPILLYFMNTVEPIFKALKSSDMTLLFETLGVKRYPIRKKSEKQQWNQLQQVLEVERNKLAINVLKAIVKSKLIPIPQQVEQQYDLFFSDPNSIYNGISIKQFLELEYSQFLSAINFLHPEAAFSTEHGVKGEEYDNVIFVISKGWNNYQFDVYAPMLNSKVPDDKIEAFERNRNLFYVCCSRPKKRLFIFVTLPVEIEFEAFLQGLVGSDNYYTYSEYINMIERKHSIN